LNIRRKIIRIIRDGGHLYPCAAGVLIGQSNNNTLEHNEIAEFFYTGVSIGWTWGYGPSAAFANRVSYNHIHHLGYRVMSDMGAIYTLGISPGTQIDHNVVHDVYASQYGGWGLYADEGSSGIRFDDNLSYHNSSTGFHQHYGLGNLVDNNIFALSRDGEITRTRREDHISFIFTRNIVFSKGDTVLQGNWNNETNVLMERNLYFSLLKRPVNLGGRDKESIQADPLFYAPEEFDFRLKPESPSREIGFTPFDSSLAGVYGDKQWIALARQDQTPAFDETGSDAIAIP
jgi:hypothetical protein